MYRIEYETVDGVTGFMVRSDRTVAEWASREVADENAELLWLDNTGMGKFVRFSVVDEQGEVYTDWECD